MAPAVPMRKAPVIVESARLQMRRPAPVDAATIFERYAADPEVLYYIGWPRHRTVADSEAFIAFSDAEWRRWPAGPYLIWSLDGTRLLGGTGFAFDTATRASVGYVLARDAWGCGYATEALRAMIDLAPRLGLRELTAACHTAHAASARVLAKCGFEARGVQPRHAVFPAIDPDAPLDALVFTRRVGD